MSRSRFKDDLAAVVQKMNDLLDSSEEVVGVSETLKHEYNDKFLLAEFLCNSMIGTLINVFETLGIDKETLKKLKTLSETSSVFLRYEENQSCKFLEKKEIERTTKDMEPTNNVSERVISRKFVTKKYEYIFDFHYSYSLSAISKDFEVIILSQSNSTKIHCNNKNDVAQKNTQRGPIDCNITWMLYQLDENLKYCFSIDRSDSHCRTPRRNDEIEYAITFANFLPKWCNSICNYHNNRILSNSNGRSTSTISDSKIFIPVIPTFRKCGSFQESEQFTVPTDEHLQKFLQESKDTFKDASKTIKQQYTNDFVSATTATMLLCFKHCQTISEYFRNSIGVIEEMLYNQLRSAIGNHVDQSDVDQYMKYHYKHLFHPEYEPESFSYSVQRANHAPEGVISLESASDSEPVLMFVNKSIESEMAIPLNASTTLRAKGDLFLHSWVSHQFSSNVDHQGLQVTARVRKFSSYILLLGNIRAQNEFHPTAGLVIQNQDDVLIPLLTKVIPTPKEFKKSIESLSNKQRAFAKAYRQMQLQNTLFGICVIQIKPQIETLLNLTSGSLSKEIQLTGDILELFAEYQIPSDLLSFSDIGPDTSSLHRLESVKENVKLVQEMIKEAKDELVKIAEQKAEFERLKLTKNERFIVSTTIRNRNICDTYAGTDIVTGKSVEMTIFPGKNIATVERLATYWKNRKIPGFAPIIDCYEVSGELWLVSESTGKYLTELIQPGPFEERSIAIILREVLLILASFHKHQKALLRVYADCIFLADDGSVSLVNPGEFYINKMTQGDNTLKHACIHSPEEINEEKLSTSTDIWSLGILAIWMARGKYPMEDIHPIRAFFNITRNDPPQLTGNFSRKFKDFVAMCLLKEPLERANAQELLDHQFIRTAGECSRLCEIYDRLFHWELLHVNVTDDSDSECGSAVEHDDCWAFSDDEEEEDSNTKTVTYQSTPRVSQLTPQPTALPLSQQTLQSTTQTEQVHSNLPSEITLPIPKQDNTGSIWEDITMFPSSLNTKFKTFDYDNALHATIISRDENWRRRKRESLLGDVIEEELGEKELEKERQQVFDLLDLITRSGNVEIVSARFHVLVMATHCFDNSLIKTVIERNVNPIAKLEWSTVIVNSTLHNQPPEVIVKEEYIQNLPKSPPRKKPQQKYPFEKFFSHNEGRANDNVSATKVLMTVFKDVRNHVPYQFSNPQKVKSYHPDKIQRIAKCFSVLESLSPGSAYFFIRYLIEQIRKMQNEKQLGDIKT